jgi:hypothetical protein
MFRMYTLTTTFTPTITLKAESKNLYRSKTTLLKDDFVSLFLGKASITNFYLQLSLCPLHLLSIVDNSLDVDKPRVEGSLANKLKHTIIDFISDIVRRDKDINTDC